jgi:flagellar hook-length control protein FliK
VITSSPINVLDLQKNKLSSLAKEASKKSSKDFDEALIEKEKKLKKKESEDMAPVHHGKVENHDNDKKAADNNGGTQKKSDKNEAKTAEAKPIDQKGTAQGTEAGKEKSAEGEVVDPAAAAKAAAAAKGELVDLLALAGDEASLSANNTAELAKNLSGKLSLEGMKMVEPQVIDPAALQAANPEKSALETLKSLTVGLEAIQPKSEGSLKDMLSKKDQGDLSQPNLGVDLTGAGTINLKENQQNHFAALLKAEATAGAENIKQSNVDNIVTQARTILKNGGGEMQVVLNPDGLGTVDLKVAVDKGHVNVEIMTQDRHVKKMFDDSLLDIRSALEGHHFKVDTLKVGVSDNFDMQQNLTQNQSNMMQQEFARDFLGQFRDERQGMRTNTLGNMLENSPLGRQQPEGIKPASRPLGGAGRLNVVA